MARFNGRTIMNINRQYLADNVSVQSMLTVLKTMHITFCLIRNFVLEGFGFSQLGAQ